MVRRQRQSLGLRSPGDSSSTSRTARFASTASRSTASDCSPCSSKPKPTRVILVAVSAGPEMELEAAAAAGTMKSRTNTSFSKCTARRSSSTWSRCAGRACAPGPSRNEWPSCRTISPGYADWDISQQPQLLELIRPDDSPILARRARRVGFRHAAAEKIAASRVWADASYGPTFAGSRSLTRANAVRFCRASIAVRHTNGRSNSPASRIARPKPSDAPNCSYERSAVARSRREIHGEQQGAGPLGRRTAHAHATSRTARSTRCFATKARLAPISAGRLLFDYHVTLGTAEDGYPIQRAIVRPAPGDDGLQVDVPVHGQPRLS